MACPQQKGLRLTFCFIWCPEMMATQEPHRFHFSIRRPDEQPISDRRASEQARQERIQYTATGNPAG